MVRARFALAAAALLFAVPASAQDAPPDLSGFWGPIFELDEPAADMVARLPENTVVIDDTGPAEFVRGDYGGLVLTPEAIAHAEQWEPNHELTLDRVCLPQSIVYALQGPFPFELYQTPQLIVIRYEYFDQVRLVFMDGRAADESMPHSKMGFSTGHWEGQDLVVETSHIAASTITNNGLDHSDDITMVERYRLDPASGQLTATQWFSDPANLQNNGARWIAWQKRPGEHVYPYECDPSFALEYEGR
jgi:hypothetical protein